MNLKNKNKLTDVELEQVVASTCSARIGIGDAKNEIS